MEYRGWKITPEPKNEQDVSGLQEYIDRIMNNILLSMCYNYDGSWKEYSVTMEDGTPWIEK